MPDQKILDNGRRIQYIAVAAQTTFVYNFLIFEKTNLDVYVDETLKTVEIDYTVTGVLNDSGGTVIFNTPLTGGERITIVSDVAKTQLVDFETGGRFNSSTINFVIDKLTVLIQQNNELLRSQGLLYETTDLLDPLKDNILPQLPANVGSGIPLWTKNTAGELVAGLLVDGDSTLRSELADETETANGAGIVGYWRPDTMAETTVRLALNYLFSVITGTAFQTGMEMFYGASTPPTGWVLANDGTIGNASSGATNRANADTEDLFTFYWTNYTDASAPIFTSAGALTTRGASAAADFAADRQIRLPLRAGRTLGVAGQAQLTEEFTVNTSNEELTITTSATSGVLLANLYVGTVVQVSNSGGFLPSPLVASTDYYVTAISGSTIKLAANTIDADRETPIDLTTTGSGTHFITIQYPNRTNGDAVGEATNLVTRDQTQPHSHTYQFQAGTAQSGGSTPGVWININPVDPDTGDGSADGLGGAAANNMPPTGYSYLIIKL